MMFCDHQHDKNIHKKPTMRATGETQNAAASLRRLWQTKITAKINKQGQRLATTSAPKYPPATIN